MKGTIIEKVDIPDSQKALIPVPTEGTIIMLVDKEGRMKVLIPVPTEGTMAKLYKINNNSTVLFR